MDEGMDKTRLEEEAFELISYIIVSARNLLHEPARYGPIRLVDAASRLIGILVQHGLASGRLEEIRKRIEEGRLTGMGDEEERKSFLESLVLHLVEEVGPGLD